MGQAGTQVIIGGWRTPAHLCELTAGAADAVIMKPMLSTAFASECKALYPAGCRIVNMMLGPTTAPVRINNLSLPVYSSSRLPSGLLSYLPGIRVENQPLTQGWSAADFLDREIDSEKADYRLLIDCPGEEHTLVDALISTSTLDRFQEIEIRCGVVPLYEETFAGPYLVDRLMKNGLFEVVGVGGMGDGIRFRWRLRRNEFLSSLSQLKSEGAEARLASDEQRDVLDHLVNCLEQVSHRQKAAEKSQRAFASNLKLALRNTRDQIVDYMALVHYFSDDLVMPQFKGWSVAPDFAAKLMRLLASGKYSAVIEFGSGKSTLIVAKAVMRANQAREAGWNVAAADEPDDGPASDRTSQQQGRHNADLVVTARQVIPAIALEHDKSYMEETRAELAMWGLVDFVNVEYAPLVAYDDGKGNHYLHYDTEDAFARLLPLTEHDLGRILVIVDGPPGSTCEQARYPAFAKVARHFPDYAADYLLDDVRREDERRIVDRWVEEAETLGMYCDVSYLSLEKGACLMSCRPIK